MPAADSATATSSICAPEMDLLIALSNCPHPLDPPHAIRESDAVDIVRYRAAPARGR